MPTPLHHATHPTRPVHKKRHERINPHATQPLLQAQIEQIAQAEYSQWVDGKKILEELEKKKNTFLEEEKTKREAAEAKKEKLAVEKKQLEIVIRLRKESLEAAKQRLIIAKNGFIEIDDPRDKEKDKDKRRKIKVRYRTDWLRDPKRGNRYFFTHWTIRAIQWALIPFSVLVAEWPKDRGEGKILPAIFTLSAWKKNWVTQRQTIIGFTAKESADLLKKITQQLEKDEKELAKKEEEIKKANRH